MKKSSGAGEKERSGSTLSAAERRRRTREGAIILAAGVAVLVFAFWEIQRPGAHDSAASNVFSFLLINLNIVLILLVIFLVVRNGMKLLLERRQRVPGSQLRGRMVTAFLAIAVFPAVVMLVISVQFSANALEDWFNYELESSLRGAWQLARTHYEDGADRAELHAERLAERLARAGTDAFTDRDALRDEVAAYQDAFALGTVHVYGSDGAPLLVLTNPDVSVGLPLPADPDLLAVALAGEIGVRAEPAGPIDVVRAVAPVGDEEGSARAVVVVDHAISEHARAWTEDIVEAFRTYRRMELNKRPFRNLYFLTMALASLVVVFSAIWLALYLARGITEPIGRLASATRRVAEGDWDVRLEEVGGDEVGSLVKSFNSMTADLAATHESLDERRRYIENILANIDAGVVAVDVDSFIATVNPAAISLLGLGAEGTVGRGAHAVFKEAGFPEVSALLEELERGTVPSGTRRNVHREEEGRTLLVIATTLVRAGGEPSGFVLFFEDVSQIVSVQRMEAWREVARRIAHEIKNPLTPIQLSAQRLHRRIGGRLEGEDSAVFDECTSTIVKEVEELKSLVNEFSQFARQPVAEKRPQDLNQVVEETMPLFQQARPDLEIRFDAASDLPRVSMNREGVKRALVNLLSNAVAAVGDAHSALDGRADPGPRHAGEVIVSTRLDRELSRVLLEVSDTGPGIPTEVRDRVFEPYFSTKDDGTGLGLAIVSSIAADHQAYVRYHENEPRGSRFVIEFPAST